MNKRYLALATFFLFLFLYFYKSFVLDIFNTSKEYLDKTIQNIYKTITSYYNQSQKIIYLEKEKLELEKKIAYFQSFYQNCKDLKLVKDANLTLVRVISYAHLPDFSEIYVKFVSKKYPLGLVYNNLAVGVLVKRVGNYSLGLLNSNEKTSYSVLIGKNEIPGIFYGKENIIKFIPIFKKINKGDLVITSGLDGIFYKGVKVGIVTDIEKEKLYQVARIKLFYDKLAPHYLYVVEKNDTIKEKGGTNE